MPYRMGDRVHNSILDRPGSPRKGHRAPSVCVSLDKEDMESGLMWGTGLRQSGDIIPAREQVYPWGAAKVGRLLGLAYERTMIPRPLHPHS